MLCWQIALFFIYLFYIFEIIIVETLFPIKDAALISGAQIVGIKANVDEEDDNHVALFCLKNTRASLLLFHVVLKSNFLHCKSLIK